MWLQFCPFEPFEADEIKGETLRLNLPTPAKLQVTFDPGPAEHDKLFSSATCSVYWFRDETARSMCEVTNGDVQLTRGLPITIPDLGPGKYMIDVRTTAAEGTLEIEGTEINRGRFYDRETVTLESGQSKQVAFAWKPFDPNAYRGNANAEIKILNGNGSVPTGRKITVSWFDGHYGYLNVFEGPLPETGVISLKGVSGIRHRSAAPFGPYTVSIDNERLAFFKLNDGEELQQVQFLVSPKAGDVAPDFEFLPIESQKTGRLSDFRGKVVLLEFWGTGCGPCQPAMQKLSELAQKMQAAWKDDVSLVAVNTDLEIDIVRTHIASHSWTGLTHVQGVRQRNEYFSDVEKAYVIHGIPHAILIDQQGNIRWRGHPETPKDGKSIRDLIDELLN